MKLDIGDEVLLRPSPVRQFFAAGTAHLISEDLDQSLVDSHSRVVPRCARGFCCGNEATVSVCGDVIDTVEQENKWVEFLDAIEHGCSGPVPAT